METVITVRPLDGDLNPRPGECQIAGPYAGDAGVVLASEMTGFMDPVSEAVTKSPGGRPGTKLVATRFTERTIVFKVTILGEGSEWAKNDLAWRKLWSYTRYTQIEVRNGLSHRVIRARLSEIEVDTTYDPHIQGAVDVTMTVVADDPFFYDYEAVASSRLGKYRKVSKVRTNLDYDTDLTGPVYPRFIITPTKNEPASSVSVFFGKTEYTFPTPDLVPGGSYIVNTDPGSRQWIAKHDPNVWARLNGIRYSLPDAGPDGERVGVSSQLTDGITSVDVVVPYERPW